MLRYSHKECSCDAALKLVNNLVDHKYCLVYSSMNFILGRVLQEASLLLSLIVTSQLSDHNKASMDGYQTDGIQIERHVLLVFHVVDIVVVLNLE